jgi:hypothetical protein
LISSGGAGILACRADKNVCPTNGEGNMNDNRPIDAQERAADTPAELPWEEIEAGRFMPRRIRGSFRGRALG